MVLFFLRHAEAERDAETDFARKLTSKGVDQAEKAGKFLLRLGIVPDVILTSLSFVPARRRRSWPTASATWRRRKYPGWPRNGS